MPKRYRNPIPKQHWKRGRTGHVICQCGEGYGSEYDGLCASCRSPKDQKIFDEWRMKNG